MNKIGILPGTVFFVALGDLASDLASFSDVVSGRAKLLVMLEALHLGSFLEP